MPTSEVKGLSAKQIQEKFALPFTPKYQSTATFKQNTKLRLGFVNENYGFKGGGMQLDLMNQWIGDFKPLKKIK